MRLDLGFLTKPLADEGVLGREGGVGRGGGGGAIGTDDAWSRLMPHVNRDNKQN